MELNLGVAAVNYTLATGFDPDPDVDYTKVKNKVLFYKRIGVRYAKNGFLLRTGLGNLELFYLGIGVNF